MFIYNVKINGNILLKIIILLLSLFMLIVFGISINRIFFKNKRFEVNDKIIKNEITEINEKNYTNILKTVHENPNSYLGMKIKFTGYIYRVLDFNENQFVIARDMYINEEESQSVVVGFLSEYNEIKNFKNGEWVEVIGTIEIGKYHNKKIPMLNIIELTLTSKPNNAFVYPPNETYVPTSGLL